MEREANRLIKAQRRKIFSPNVRHFTFLFVHWAYLRKPCQLHVVESIHLHVLKILSLNDTFMLQCDFYGVGFKAIP